MKMKILVCIFLSILAQEASVKELEDDIKGEFYKISLDHL